MSALSVLLKCVNFWGNGASQKKNLHFLIIAARIRYPFAWLRHDRIDPKMNGSGPDQAKAVSILQTSEAIPPSRLGSRQKAGGYDEAEEESIRQTLSRISFKEADHGGIPVGAVLLPISLGKLLAG